MWQYMVHTKLQSFCTKTVARSFFTVIFWRCPDNLTVNLWRCPDNLTANFARTLNDHFNKTLIYTELCLYKHLNTVCCSKTHLKYDIHITFKPKQFTQGMINSLLVTTVLIGRSIRGSHLFVFSYFQTLICGSKASFWVTLVLVVTTVNKTILLPASWLTIKSKFIKEIY